MSKCGAYPAERVWVTGGLWLDYLVAAPPDGGSARQRLKLPMDQRLILVATQPYPWFPTAVRAVLEACKSVPDCTVCVKLHPNDFPLDLYRTMVRETGADNVRLFETDFYELLAACDVLISGSSTAVLEAIVLGRKTICINFSSEPDKFPYVEDGGALVPGPSRKFASH